MKNYYISKNNNLKCFFISCLALVFSLGINAQSAEFTIFSSVYSQNFDGLDNQFNNNDIPWENGNTPLLGWYGYKNMDTTPDPSVTYGTGCDNDGSTAFDFPAGNSLNSLGHNPAGGIATDRALGFRVANSGGDAAMMLNITNNSSSPILSLEVTYTGEQWASVGGDVQTLDFSYKVDATAPIDADFTAVPALNFLSPTNSGVDGTTSTVRIDGNLPENKTVGITAAFNVTIPVSSTITLRWDKISTGQADHILALDDLTVTASSTALSVSDFETGSVKFIVNSNNLNIVSDKTTFNKISLFAITGALVKEQNISNSRNANVSISQLKSGIYIARVTSENGETFVKKFVK